MSMLAPGSIVQERYRVDHLIGQGGFGAVYEAVDERLGRRVALKRLLRISDRISRQFEREARLLANLDHPSLPSVIDHFSTPDGQYLVMQFVRGTDLAEQLAQRDAPFPVAQVLAWGDQALDVLHYLHTLQPPIVHRDIKPQNIKLKADGTIMLLDFGLAKGFAGESPPSTTEGSLLAYTKGYAPPEQIEGTGTDARSDLYALGATLHCLLTNVLPVEAAMRLLADARGRADPLRPAHELNPAVPEAVSRVIELALALEPDQRPASAEQMRALLRAAASRSQPEPPAPSAQTRVLAAQAPAHPGPPVAFPTQQPPAAPATQQPTVVPATQQPTVAPAAQVERSASGRPTNAPPAQPAPSRPQAPRSRLWRAGCLAAGLGGALLALCLAAAAVASTRGWFSASGVVAANPSPALLSPIAASAEAPSAQPSSAQPSSATGTPPPSTGAPPPATATPIASPSPAPSRPDALVSSTRLNLRAGPGEEYAIKASYGEGTPLRVLGKHAGSSWLYVQAPDGQDGWMFADFLLVNVPLANVAFATPPPTPRPAAPTATQAARPTPTTMASPVPSTYGENSARIIAIWPEPGTPLDAGQPQEFQIKLEYSLQTAAQAIAVLSLEQFPADAGGCSGLQHRTNGRTEVPIQRGQGIATVQVTWNGAAGSGFVSPGVTFWTDAGGQAARPLIEGFGVLREPCYPYGE